MSPVRTPTIADAAAILDKPPLTPGSGHALADEFQSNMDLDSDSNNSGQQPAHEEVAQLLADNANEVAAIPMPTDEVSGSAKYVIINFKTNNTGSLPAHVDSLIFQYGPTFKELFLHMMPHSVTLRNETARIIARFVLRTGCLISTRNFALTTLVRIGDLPIAITPTSIDELAMIASEQDKSSIEMTVHIAAERSDHMPNAAEVSRTSLFPNALLSEFRPWSRPTTAIPEPTDGPLSQDPKAVTHRQIKKLTHQLAGATKQIEHLNHASTKLHSDISAGNHQLNSARREVAQLKHALDTAQTYGRSMIAKKSEVEFALHQCEQRLIVAEGGNIRPVNLQHPPTFPNVDQMDNPEPSAPAPKIPRRSFNK